MKIITDTTELKPAFDLSRIAPVEDILFFDIETTGLRKESTQVYLIGCAFFHDGSWKIRQYLAESALDEREVMESFADFASSYKVLIHFNGDGFDIPYLAYKAEFYDLDLDFSTFQSIDIYKLAKPLKKLLGLESMSQKSIERFLQINRDDLYGGGALIPVFYEFERSADKEAEDLLLLHNYDDVKGMLQLLAILNYTGIIEGAFRFEEFKVIDHTAVFDFELEMPLPVSFEKHADNDRILIAADGKLLQLNIKIYDGIAKLPLPDVENYYYLPDEDRVIHKDVAQFVDKSHRKKATKKNCYLKKEGQFLPQKHTLFTPAFSVEGESRKSFFELQNSVTEDHRILTEYALDIINL